MSVQIITQTLIEPLSEEEKIQSESVEADTGLPPTNDSYDCSSLVQNYGIKFCDVCSFQSKKFLVDC